MQRSPEMAVSSPAAATDHGPAVVTIGLHGSASTWVFNVVRELMEAAFGSDAVFSLYAENAADILGDPQLPGRRVVWKTHSGGPSWDGFVWLARPRVILSIRDPRDGVVSLMRRFGAAFRASIQAVAQDCRRALRCAEAGALLLRYEDRFFDDPAAVERLATELGLDLPPQRCRAIFETYRTEKVREFAASLDSLPAERLAGDGTIDRLDRLTQFHRTHIDDGRIGKWRDLDPSQQELLTRTFAPFLDRFGYSP